MRDTLNTTDDVIGEGAGISCAVTDAEEGANAAATNSPPDAISAVESKPGSRGETARSKGSREADGSCSGSIRRSAVFNDA
jgi:hypothetical protein